MDVTAIMGEIFYWTGALVWFLACLAALAVLSGRIRFKRISREELREEFRRDADQ